MLLNGTQNIVQIVEKIIDIYAFHHHCSKQKFQTKCIRCVQIIHMAFAHKMHRVHTNYSHDIFSIFSFIRPSSTTMIIKPSDAYALLGYNENACVLRIPPRHPMITYIIDSYQIPSQNNTKSEFKFAKNCIIKCVVIKVSGWCSTWWHFKSQASQLFTQPLFRHRSKKTSKLHITGLFCGEFTGDWWIPCTKGQ